MAVFKSGDIAGKKDSEGRITCRECMSIEEFNELERDEIIKQADLQKTDDTYFCDECEKRLC